MPTFGDYLLTEILIKEVHDEIDREPDGNLALMFNQAEDRDSFIRNLSAFLVMHRRRPAPAR